MSKKFIEKKLNDYSLSVARRQYKQLSYFISSKIQEDFGEKYFEEYIERKYYNDDVFLNYVKGVFKQSNFLTFAKYYREPNPASSLIHTRIKEPLSRVFFSEDSYFRYYINGEKVEYHPEILEDDFNEKLFDAVISRYNDIIVHDLYDSNKPYREFVSIDKIVSIEMFQDEITKIAYSAKIEVDGEPIYGYAYIDDKKYQFYNSDLDLVQTENHDFGKCPVTFVVKRAFSDDPIVKESIFSHLRSELEEYAFLRTIQKMADANGTLPIAVMLDTDVVKENSDDFKTLEGEPMSAQLIGGQVSEVRGEAGVSSKGNDLQAGTIIKIPPVFNDDGDLQMELVENYITFHYTPVEALKNLADRIAKLEKSVIVSTLGDFSEGNEGSMNELQVSKGYVSKEDKLRWMSNTMSYSKQLSDSVMLTLAYGKNNANCEIFFGSDFFKEDESTLYERFKNAPNTIEEKNILIRLAQRRNMYNKHKSRREVILYKILPYCSNNDFKLAIEQQQVDPITFSFQTKFNYWVSLFEANYGDIVDFWESSKANEGIKILEITKLITSLIKINTNTNTLQENGKESEEQ